MSKSKFLQKIKDDKGKILKIKRDLMGIVPVQGGVQLKECVDIYFSVSHIDHRGEAVVGKSKKVVERVKKLLYA